MRRLKIAAVAVLLVAGLGVAACYVAYRDDMTAIRQRLADGSELAGTGSGPVEYASWGGGPPVLAIHGAGGGYDQGRLMVEAFGGDGFRWIAVSRFGYLRSALPADGSTAAQADAFADLLDILGIDRVRILAMSGGVPPALQFAIRHPDRTAALALLSSAPFTPLTAAEQEAKRPIPPWLYRALFSWDFPFWILSRLAPDRLTAIFDMKPGLRQRLTAAEQDFVAGITASFLPVTARSAGLANEATAIDPAADYELARIAAPTLVVHARNDGINDFAFGEYAAAHIPGATFLPLADGGHLLLGHFDEVRQRIAALFRQPSDATDSSP